MSTSARTKTSGTQRVLAFLMLAMMVCGILFGGSAHSIVGKGFSPVTIAHADMFDFVDDEDGTINSDVATGADDGTEWKPASLIGQSKKIAQIIVGIVGVVCLTAVVIAGVRIAVSGSNDMARAKAIKAFWFTLIGAAIVGGASTIFGFAFGIFGNL